MTDKHQSPRILRRPQVEEKTGLGRTAIYSRINPKDPYHDPSFPKPIPLGGGKNPPVGWLESELDSWIEAQAAKARCTGMEGGK